MDFCDQINFKHILIPIVITKLVNIRMGFCCFCVVVDVE